jgi:hypothetical protein
MAQLNCLFLFNELDLKGSRKKVVLALSLAAYLILLAGCDSLPQRAAAASAKESAPSARVIALPSSLSSGNVGTNYHAVLSVSGGRPPYHFEIAEGTLPPGLALNSVTGGISGTPTQVGRFPFVISVTAPLGASGIHPYMLAVSSCLICVSVQISPANPSVTPGAKLQFAALVSNTSNTAVTWSSTGGAISDNGLFTVPNEKAGTVFQIRATSQANSAAQGFTTLAIASSSTSGGGSPGSGSSSTSTSAPTTGPDNRYCDAGDVPNFGPSDGPAAAPTACYETAQSATPSPGTVIQVSPHSNLQTAVNEATCGDTLVLQAGQAYPGFTLPAKNCDTNHYITIRSSALGSGLPAEGVRATPCNAGVSSLPGRPALNCASTNNVMAQIAGTANASQIINTEPGANYYRLVGLEVADTEANGRAGGYYDLVMLTSADHIILDRCWIHGSPIGEDVKGVFFTDSSYVAVVDSYISDIHSKLSGYGADSSAVGSVTGTGPVKIVDNFLEASGVSILWGGGASSANVSDVELRRNHIFKPFTWWTASPSYFGTAFEVKNLFESKTGIRQFVEGNIFEDNWAQAQKGTAILFGPRNQYGKCPGCTVHDVIFRYNIVRHAVNGIGLAPVYATTCPGEAGDGTGHCRYLSGGLYNMSIHDNLLDDISESTYSPGDCCSDGFLFNIETDQPTNWPHDITIDHNTGFPVGSGIANITIDGAPQVIANFSFNNNLMTTGDSGFHQVLPGKNRPGCGAEAGAGMLGTLNGCMGNTWVAAGNLFANTSSPLTKLPGSPLPARNFEAPNWDAVGFMDFSRGNGGNYQLGPGSPYKNVGTDGKDPGADVESLQTATAGVL